jgi:uncharacterized protein (DUF488 family)
VDRVLTIGVYGWSAERWIAALQAAGCDLVVDIRARRGVRGREHAFANRTRLEAALEEADIRYIHLPELAPSRAVRDAQVAADAGSGTRKRDRTVLGQAFVDRYQREVVDRVTWADVAERLDAVAPALLCVERVPTACHRSIVASRLAITASVPIEDLIS